MWYLFPSNLTIEGLHIAIPLYVIFLNGTVSDVGITIAVQYCCSALGSIFWGKIIDRYHVKRIILLVCFSVITVCSFWIYMIEIIPMIFIASGLVGFFNIGKNPVTHLMVMESNPNNQWSRVFATTSVISSIGSLTAFVIGALWEQMFDLRPYFLLCGTFSMMSFVASFVVGKNSFLERHSLSESIHGISFVLRHHRMHHHVYFPKTPHRNDFKHILILFRGKIHHEIGILFVANFFFYFGSNMYFTIFIPFLKQHSFTNSQIFAVYLIQTVAMLSVFFLVPRITSRFGEEKTLKVSYIPRILGIIITGTLIPMTLGNDSFLVAAAASVIMVIGFSIYSTANSVILFKTIPKGFEGRLLGVNSFMIGIGIFSASLLSGFLSSSYGYQVSFALASVLLGVSFVIFMKFKKSIVSQRALVH